MQHPVPPSLLSVCRDIVEQNKSVSDWARIESDDMFQGDEVVGGFDADERAFCFSLTEAGIEYWFQVTLDEVHGIVDGTVTTVDVRPADS